ncbi:MAG: hypothetical protein A2556_00910 [Candidatus Vogelbacteria bacterium RIFOXYD2_FULL_44_9]|uniref:Uncharacterized protein n=1 Tax=Candidatus Vogelbacteria bacterium RIFOXYD2_FULL_44_9 TaxID=1802441 RepID=A0A1G2QNB9_9BACT|nr:MAG: hypothetical protein A2556_00910 [Candidatus Vogelbacteria bacterium RIFOXYD2_FULL_44_9]
MGFPSASGTESSVLSPTTNQVSALVSFYQIQYFLSRIAKELARNVLRLGPVPLVIFSVSLVFWSLFYETCL